jgi:hypothetical protein
VYEPDYNEYDAAPRIVREVGVRYRAFDDERIVDDQRLVDGNRIELTMFDGEYRQSEAGSGRIQPVLKSGPSQRLPVENARPGEPVVVAVPTMLEESTWNETLAPQRVENGGHVRSVSVVEGSPRNTLLVELEPGIRYQLETAVVGFGDAERAAPVYMRSVGDAGVDLGSNGTASVRVYDRYNNPVPGVTLDANLSSGEGDLVDAGTATDATEVTTGPDGNATVTYSAPNSLEAAVVRFSLPDAAGVPNVSLDRPVYVGFEEPPVTLAGAAPGDADDEVDVGLQNLGPERNILGVKLVETRRLDAEEVASRSGLSGTLGGIVDDAADLFGSDFSLIQEDIVQTRPGPQVLEDVQTGSDAATDNDDIDELNAVAGGPVAPFGDVLEPIGRYETDTLTLEFTADDAFGGSDVLVVRLEVYYSDGYTETYTVQVPAD